ncbi:MAG: hypothetical protein LV473_13685 [Nitrospira sp.]|nr:hypothetical protein [Nitrospira sp.]
MKRSMMVVAMLGLIMLAHAAFADDGTIPTTPTPPVDVVTLKDGSVIYGEVIEMTDGLLQIKNALAADIIKVKWAEVSKLTITHPIPFHLKEGTVLVGTVEESEPGNDEPEGRAHRRHDGGPDGHRHPNESGRPTTDYLCGWCECRLFSIDGEQSSA